MVRFCRRAADHTQVTDPVASDSRRPQMDTEPQQPRVKHGLNQASEVSGRWLKLRQAAVYCQKTTTISNRSYNTKCVTYTGLKL